MSKSILELTTSTRYLHVVKTGLGVVVLAIFIALMTVPMMELSTHLAQVITRVIQWGPWVFLVGILALLPAFYQYFLSVRNGAPIFSKPSSGKYYPWPAHSHPAARRAAWDALAAEADVHGRRTRIVVHNNVRAEQKVLLLRICFIAFLLIIACALLLAPLTTRLLVYEVTPPHIEAIRHHAYMAWPLLVFWGLIALVFTLSSASVRIRTAEFDKLQRVIKLSSSRFFGLLNKFVKPFEETVRGADVAGLQLISYRSKTLRRNKRLVTQYELNMVLHNGSRHHLTKHSGHASVQKDAIRLARFLNVPVWDRSGNYYPDARAIMQPPDPIIQSL